uniref:Uncharacterized protein n=1 Tax=Romanomermis culicivorax TaxID=13658 RepID=A0A915I7X6_ROMCU
MPMMGSKNEAYDTVEETTTPDITTTQKSRSETSRSQTRSDKATSSAATYTQMRTVSKTGGEKRGKGVCMGLDHRPTAFHNMRTVQQNLKST